MTQAFGFTHWKAAASRNVIGLALESPALPSDRDMDRMMAFLEKAWRRLIEMANRVQKDVTGRI